MLKDLTVSRRAVLAGAAASVAPLARAKAQSSQIIRLGILTDLSGPFRDNAGATSIACAQQAIEDLGMAARGMPVEIVTADHQNKPDVGIGIAREWFDRGGVDAVVEVNNGAVALAMNDLVAEKNKVHICSGAGAAEITGIRCTPNTTHWQTDTWMYGRIADAVMAQGGNKWFYVAANYATGKQLRTDGAAAVEALGGKVVGYADYQFPTTTDFSSYLLQAQAAGANVIAFCNAGTDLINCIKQSHEFGLNKTMMLVGVVTFLNNIRALGLETSQGLLCTEPFYWDLNDRTRAFMNRIKPKVPDNWPNGEHAATYAGVMHYLKAVADMGVGAAKASGVAAVQRMKKIPTDDDCFGKGTVREDGRSTHPLYLFQVKAPSESKGPNDFYKVLGTIPVERAIRPLDQGGCKFDDRFKPA